MTTRSYASRAQWSVPVPAMHVSAGAAGAMLTITLLHSTELSFDAGHVVVIHDPVGLTAERLLAHVYRAAVERGSEGPWRAASAVGARWLAVQSPMAAMWPAVHTLRARRWRAVPERGLLTGSRATLSEGRPLRVAEPQFRGEFAARAPAGLLLLSESARPDALSTGAAARLLSRCLKRGWASLAATREGPVRSAVYRDDANARAGETEDTPLWRSHVVCEGGMLRPVVSR